MSGHEWEEVGGELRREANPLGFRWACLRCGSVSGQESRPSALATVAHADGPLDCDAILVREVMES